MEIVAIIILLIIGVTFIPFLMSGISGAVFYPTGMHIVKEALDIVKIRQTDKIVDLGSGDGRFLFEAAKYSDHVTGVEIHPLLIIYTTICAWISHTNVNVQFKDFWGVNLRDYDVIFVFLIPRRMKQFEKKLMDELKPGAKVISYAFKLPNKAPEYRTDSGLYVYTF